MIIERIELHSLEVPLARPFKTARRTVDRLESVVVKVHGAQDLSGLGAAPQTLAVTGESVPSMIAALSGPLSQAVVGQSLEDLNHLLNAVQGALVGNSSAKAAMEIALFDIWSQSLGRPLCELLGGRRRPLSTNLTISLDDPRSMAASARSARDQGYSTLKIKLGRDPALDLDRLRAVRDAVGETVAIRLDANQGWRPKEAVKLLEQIAASGINPGLVEQPTPAGDLRGLKFVTDNTSIPVMADESAATPEEVFRIIEQRAADQINVKLMKAGGLSRALRIIDMAATAGLEVMMGCMLESTIGILAAAHIASAKPEVSRIDLDASAFLTHDPVRTRARVSGPLLELSDGPGLGIDGVDGLREVS